MRNILLAVAVGLACFSQTYFLDDLTLAHDKKDEPGKQPKKNADGELPWMARPMRMAESKPVVIGGAEFVAVTESEWKYERPINGRAPIDIRLRIVNKHKSEVAFPTFETIRLRLKRANGQELEFGGGSDVTIAARPVLLAPNGSYSLHRNAELQWDRARASGELTYFDGTGMQGTFRNLVPGNYKLFFRYRAQETSKPRMTGIAGAPIWSGDAITSEVPFTIVSP